MAATFGTTPTIETLLELALQQVGLAHYFIYSCDSLLDQFIVYALFYLFFL